MAYKVHLLAFGSLVFSWVAQAEPITRREWGVLTICGLGIAGWFIPGEDKSAKGFEDFGEMIFDREDEIVGGVRTIRDIRDYLWDELRKKAELQNIGNGRKGSFFYEAKMAIPLKDGNYLIARPVFSVIFLDHVKENGQDVKSITLVPFSDFETSASPEFVDKVFSR